MATFSTTQIGKAKEPNEPRARTRRSKLRAWILFAVVWAVSLAYTGANLKRGWIPHDEGAFAQSAERVLHGQLPHRDFDELYTGGLSFMNAGAFRIFGVNLLSLRIPLFLFFAAWVPATFYVASRFLEDYAAGGVTLLAVAYSVPNYSAAVPSWYNLFFAVFGLAALLRYLETRAQRWLFCAGLCGGLSVVVKISGLYFVAAALLFFIYREQNLAVEHDDELSSPMQRFAYPLIIALGLISFLALLTAMILKFPGLNQLFNFVLPSAALVMLLLRQEFSETRASSGARFRTLIEMSAPFAAGALLPIAIFLVPYIATGSTRDLIRGVFVIPERRLGYASLASPSFAHMLPAIGLLLIFAVAYRLRGQALYLFTTAMAGVAGVLLTKARASDFAYAASWNALETSIPFVVLAAAILLGFSRFASGISSQRRQQAMLVVSGLALGTLVQFPFSAQIYFCYVAPLLVLAFAATLSCVDTPPRVLCGVALVFFTIFVVWNATPGFVYSIGQYFDPDAQAYVLKLPRAGGLRGDAERVQVYDELIPLVQAHAGGEYIYAGPDSPEVYFLSGLKNPTPTLFDFLDDPQTHTQHLLNAIEAHHVKVLALNEQPQFSGATNDAAEDVLMTRFPYAKRVGNFEVRWRD